MSCFKRTVAAELVWVGGCHADVYPNCGDTRTFDKDKEYHVISWLVPGVLIDFLSLSLSLSL